MLREHPDTYAVNASGIRVYIGPVPGVGEVLAARKVDEVINGVTQAIPHLSKQNAQGGIDEYRATVSGWVKV